MKRVTVSLVNYPDYSFAVVSRVLYTVGLDAEMFILALFPSIDSEDT